ncbi:hypothetical protein LTR62_008082 [Meristemomyces frigidus]|uniref:Phosphoglycerate mutase n=1 Tax=Meristemomyces frigidus TaxID=1508187 RepID=A0AAN7YHG1_9PEZI|nr:hypothetical protein LTR62_008082 [Meristemomyces frigidus]
MDSLYNYETIPGFFLQDDAATDPATFDYTQHNFGLINRSYTSNSFVPGRPIQWQKFSAHLQYLIDFAPPGTKYKLLYLARHGEGDHNVAESYYGTKAWDDYWSKLDGNGTVVWSDALLTAIGEGQAREAGKFLAEQFTLAKMPEPEGWVVSPLRRCLHTCQIEWSGAKLRGHVSFRPVVKEMVRETMGEHTCDRRSNKSAIHQIVSEWAIEDGFKEEDELWQVDHRETWAEHDVRSRALFDDLFSGDFGDVLSITAHSGTVASLLRITGHRTFQLPTGGMMPLFVKATRRSQ